VIAGREFEAIVNFATPAFYGVTISSKDGNGWNMFMFNYTAVESGNHPFVVCLLILAARFMWSP